MSDKRRRLLRKALDRLIARCVPLQSDQRFVALVQKGDSLEEEEVLEAVSDVFLDPEVTVPVLGLFRSFARRTVGTVVELLRLINERLGEMMDIHGGEGRGSNSILEAVGAGNYMNVLSLAPFVLGSILKYFQFSPPPFGCLRQSSLATSQVEFLTSFIGHLILIQQHQRVLAYGLSSKLQNLRKLLSPMEIHGLGVGATVDLTHRQHATYKSMWHQKRIFDNLCQIFRESMLLLGNIKGVHLSSCDGLRDDVNGFVTLD